MAHAKTHIIRGLFAVLAGLVVLAAVVAVLMFYPVGQAQGSGEEDSSTLGLGSAQSYSDGNRLTAADRAAAAASSTESQVGEVTVSEATEATESAQRSITVKDPDPVVVPVAVDETNSEAVAKANEVCTLNPLPTAPQVAPDVNDGTWQTGVASAYCVATNDDGSGNFGVSTTASGIALTDNSVTVAVPESQADLLGHIVEICYDGKVVIATVTDTGGFEQYGRVLDLAPGVYKAFGCASYDDWGLRTVSYRFL